MPVSFSFSRLGSSSTEHLASCGALEASDFTDGADRAEPRGDDHVTQTLACCSCRSFVRCGGVGADLRLRLGWWLARWWLARRMAWWMAPRLGRSPLLRRRPRLWLRRLLCAATCSDPVGAPLAAGKSLLLSPIAHSWDQEPRPSCGRGFSLIRIERNRAPPSYIFLPKRPPIRQRQGNIYVPATCTASPARNDQEAELAHEQPNHGQQRTDRSQDLPINLRCRRRTAATEPARQFLASVVPP